jgi:PAS domain S-box-containing protein
MNAPLPHNEAQRQRTLEDYEILDTGSEAAFDDITLLASRLLNVPIAAISFVDRDRQAFKSCRGLSICQTPRDQAFCAHSIMTPDRLTVVPDATKDPRFAENPLVTGEVGIRFYAGAPLLAPDGTAIGTLCVIDRVPRQPDAEGLEALTTLARQVMELVNARLKNRQLARTMKTITQRKHLMNEAERLARMGAWELDVTTNKVTWSDEVFRIHDLPIGKPPSVEQAVGYYPQEARPTLARAITRAIEHGVGWDLKLPLHTEAGRNLWVRVSGRPDFVDGKCIRLWGLFQDITEDHRRQIDLERYRTIINHSTDLVSIKDDRGCYELVNPMYLSLLGLTASHVIGKTAEQVFGEALGGQMRQRELTAIESRAPATYEEDLIVAGRRNRWLTTRIPILNENRMVTHVVGISRNIEVQRQAHELLERARLDADAANRAKSEFLANMSHEIRTPMAAILGFCDVLADRPATDVADDALRTIRRNGEHLLTLISDILDVSKIEAGKMTIESIPLSTDELIEQVMSLMRPRAQARPVGLRCERGALLPASFVSDPTRLRQVLINLVGNAIKFTERGEVVLRISATPRYGAPLDWELVFEVIDTGIGMSADELARLFVAFRQADESTTRRFGGTGLGLLISRQLTTMLGGTIEVTSTRDVGSRFKVVLPVKAHVAEPVVERPAAPSLLPNIRRDLRILAADDAPDNRKLLGFMFRKAGLVATFVENGEEALNAVSNAAGEGVPFEVVFLDMQMPIVDGYTAARRLRDTGFTGRIIALTANAMSEDRQRCLDAGCDEFLTKPVDRVRLYTLLEDASTLMLAA